VLVYFFIVLLGVAMPLNTKSEERDPQAANFWLAVESLPCLSFGHVDLADAEVRGKIYQRWQTYIKISPTDFYESLTQDLPEGTNCELILAGKQATIAILHPQADTGEEDSSFFTYSRELHVEGDVLTSCNADIRVKQRNKSIGRILQRNMIGALRDIGYASLSAASNDVGGYAWAKMGYVFNEAATSDADKQQFVSVLRERLGQAHQYLPTEMVGLVRQNINLCHGNDNNALADLDFSLNPTLKTIFEKEAISPLAALDNVFLRSAQNFMREMTNDYQTQDSQELWQNFNQSGQNYTLGKYLLLKTHWNSFLDFSDKKQMKRVEAYLGL
jgi:hypothetical protein